MVICKFFLQGTCKFGDACKFEHQLNDHNYGGNSSILLQNYASKPQTTSNVDTNTLVKAVVTDMTSAEKGGQWLLSSYAPFKEKPAFPGFEDHSMEEIRFLFYESVKNGSLEQYKQNLQMMLQQAMMKIKALQNPSPDAINMLKNIYDTPPSSNFSNNQVNFNTNSSPNSTFGASSSSQTVFGNTNSNQTVFRSNNTQQNVFGSSTNTNSMFGSSQATNTMTPTSIFGAQQPQNKSIFGATAPQQTSNSIFGKNPSVFGGGAQQQIFAKTQQNTAFRQTSQSPFGQTTVQQQQSQSPFAQNSTQQQNQSPFGQTTTQSAFVQNSGQQQNQSPFGQTTTQSAFTHNLVQQQNQSRFGQTTNQQQPNQTVFAQNSTQSQNLSPFGQPTTQQQQLQSPSAFAQTQQQNQSLFGQNTPQQPTIFQQNANQQNQFGPTNNSPFGQNQYRTQIANQGGSPQIGLVSAQHKPAMQHSQNIFGNLSLQPTSGAGFVGGALPTKPNDEFYSKLEELSEEEIKWFQSDDLDISKIPEKPPTYEMCFKVQ